MFTYYGIMGRSTVCVTCGWAGVDKTSRAGFCSGVEKARKCRRIPPVQCTTKERGSFFTAETVQRFRKVYSKEADQQAVQSSGGALDAAPRCTVVAGQIDLYTGGEGVFCEDPDEKANLISDRDLPKVREEYPCGADEGVDNEKER